AKLAGLFLAPFLFLIFLLTPPQWGLPPDAWKVVAMAALMLVWWVTEAVPLPVTALVPLICLPLLGVSEIKTVAASYGDPVVFLFLGGFMLGLAMEKWNLHRRIALSIVNLTGTNADGIVFGFMLATALISMWISNTATAIMMLPIALSIIRLLSETQTTSPNHSSSLIPHPSKGLANFSRTIMLGIAYAASFGGMGTLIGTPPNTVFKGFMKTTFGYHVNFFDWMVVGVPLALLLVFLGYLVNVKLLFPNKLGNFHGPKDLIKSELAALGKPSVAERRTFWVFGATVFLWIATGLLQQIFPEGENPPAGVALLHRFSDEIIALLATFGLFIVPVNFKKAEFLLKWKDTKEIPWGILLLFGGGLALAGALSKTGIIKLVGDVFAGMEVNRFLFVLGLTAVTVLLSELMSNVALVTVFLPVVGAVAQGLGIEPIHLAIPVTLAASCGFMLPMATPPNAIVFGGGYLRVYDMVRSGFWLDLLSILLIAILAETVMLWVF
ncbi:MAG: DASS family sodium-coupled anion symporter, partial [Bacteroidota bacterium]